MNANRAAQTGLGTIGTAAVALAAAWLVVQGPSRAAADEPKRVERLEQEGGPPLEGRLLLDPRAGFRFQASSEPATSSRPVEAGRVIDFADREPSASSIPPLFQARIGESARISGMLRRVAENGLQISVPWQAQAIELRRPGVQSLVQRIGEARVLVDSFDKLDGATWAVGGTPEIVADAGPAPADRALRLPPGGASIERRFEEALGAGRIDLTFRDDGKIHPDQQWTLVLTLREPTGPANIRIVLGWSEDSLAVESPAGPALAVQRLARAEGWRRLAVRFDADRTEIAVDGKELAHGKGPPGPLESIRIASSGPPSENAGPGGIIGEIQVARFAQPPSSLEIDPTQDEARLVVGDQLFGAIRQGDSDRVEMTVDDRPVVLDWSDLAGVFLRRTPAEGAPVQGALARVEWRVSAGDPTRDFDFAEGAVSALSDSTLTLATPFAGTLQIPRDRLIRLRVLEPGWRLVIDPASHHLGNEIEPRLDPPLPEGSVLERSFELPNGLDGPKFLALDVILVVGETPGLPFSDFVRRGELKTFVEINGVRFDYLNRFVHTANETPERIRIPIRADLLKPGKNQLRIVQTGLAKLPTEYDDLGILGVAVEVADPNGRPGVEELPKEPVAAPTP
ncbi:hypothetical protein [Paludisphaera borealis]|uniref:Uncharacterized protein n=1 Tax=Paludisphaera borealis TaxID=1387353 RepID=A0A1U7CWH0_9BACT|nr:hypothetical protein [Paludisphaera borealis]APW63292.1 hypothetical protein BSF38_04856 [Paludisphaera borealis]